MNVYDLDDKDSLRDAMTTEDLKKWFKLKKLSQFW